MISSRMLTFGLCAAVFALAVPMLAQDIPVISSENAAALARTIPSEMFAEGSRGLRAIPNSTLFVYRNFAQYDEEAERELYDAAEGAPGPVYPMYAPHSTVIDYTQAASYGLDGYWALSPDGRLWAAYYHHGEPLDGPTELQLIDVATEEVLFTLFSGPISTSIQARGVVYFSPGSNFVMLYDGALTIWNTHTGEQLDLDRGGDQIAFNGDETLLVNRAGDYASDDVVVQVWSIETGELLQTIEESDFSGLWSIELIPHTNLLLLRGSDKTSLWNLDTEEKIPLPPGDSLFFSGSGTRLVLVSWTETDTTLTFWDLEAQTEIISQTLTAKYASFLRDEAGSRVVFYADGLNALVLDGTTGEQVAELKTRDLDSAVFSPDGTLLVTWKGRFFTIWSLDTGEELAEFEMANPDDVPEMTVEIDALQFSADGKAILLLPTFGTVEIWTVGD